MSAPTWEELAGRLTIVTQSVVDLATRLDEQDRRQRAFLERLEGLNAVIGEQR